MEHKLHNRILSALLALVLVLTGFPVSVFAEGESVVEPETMLCDVCGEELCTCDGADEEDTFVITCDGKTVEQVQFYKFEKRTVVAENIPEGCHHQWQILIPGTNIWVDIMGQTTETLELSWALLGSLLDDGESAYVRCNAVQDGEVFENTSVLCAKLVEELDEESSNASPVELPSAIENPEEINASLMSNMETASDEGAEVISDDSEIVSVTIEYIYWDRLTNTAGDKTWDPYVAYIKKGTASFEDTVPNKTVPGYKTELAEDYTDDNTTVEIVTDESTGTSSVVFSLTNVTEDRVFKVYYKEVMVPYYARYFLQNVYNDLYTEKTDVLTQDQKDAMLGYAGDEPDETKIYPNIDGFSALFHQPDTIAADGSTVFEVYYDRNYYLINFDMGGGFGTSPVYARYETAFTVANPTRPGYTFAGWELTKGTVPDGAETDSYGLVTKVPASNLTYTAKWTQNDTVYTVAYWILDEDKEIYIGSRVESAGSGTIVSGKDDILDADMCVLEEHNHDASCYSCGLLEHTHSVDQCETNCTHTHTTSCIGSLGTDGASEYDLAAIQAIGDNEPQVGYIYAINIEGQTETWSKLYMGTDSSGNHIWYGISADMVYGTALGVGTASTYTARKYVADLSSYGCTHIHGVDCDVVCDETAHIHEASCCSCGYVTHTHHYHTVDCYYHSYAGDASSLDAAAVSELTSGNPENGCIYVVNAYYANYDTSDYYKLFFDDGDGIVETSDFYKVDSSQTTGDGTYLGQATNKYRVTKYDAIRRCGYDECSTDCNVAEHTHSESCAACGKDAHTHSDDCQQSEYARHVVFLADETDQNVVVEGDGSTVVNVYYTYKTYTIRYIYAKTDGTNYYLASQTKDGSFENSLWQYGISADNLPAVDDPSGAEGRQTVKIGDYTYYYISLSAKYGADISDLWPSKNIESVNDTYFWGSWSAAPGTGYRIKYGDEHANIVGPYPTMSADMIAPTTAELEDGTYLAQYMIAWWATSDMNVEDHVYHNFFEVLSLPEEASEGESVRTSSLEIGGVTYTKYDYVSEADGTTNATYIVNVSGDENHGKVYELSSIVFTAAHNGDTRVDPVTFAGVHAVNDSRNSDTDSQANSSAFKDNPECPADDGSHEYCNVFVYNLNLHKLKFWNYNAWLTTGDGVEVAYGMPLAKFEQGTDGQSGASNLAEKSYPSTLEPKAYVFDGWYTTAECLPGTQMDWDRTMPDSDLTVYASWVPVTYDVYFYLDYDRYQSGTVFKAVLDTAHGEPMITSDINLTPSHENSAYHFVGWFYIDADGDKVAFNPAEMAVRQDLRLYAEWTSTISKKYTIHYIQGNEDGTIVLDEDGNPISLADDTTGYAFEATTRTFKAKSVDQLNLLDEDQKDLLWLPNTNSHSILMKADESQNVFSFVYIQKDVAPYIVKYVDATTGDPVKDTVSYPDNKNAVVTEQFVYVEGYIPDAFYKTLILSANEEENVIVFYYTKDDTYEEDTDKDDDKDPDSQSARYLITHYIEDLTGGTYSIYDTDDSTDLVGKTISVEALSIPGFSFDSTKTESEKGTNTLEQTDGVWTLSGVITTGENPDEALQLELYYKRESYKYRVQYLERGTEKELSAEIQDEALFKATVQQSAPTISGYELYSNASQEITISYDESLNVITFYYTAIPVTINYYAVVKEYAASDFGKVSRSSENPVDATAITGAQAIVSTGFYFDGWYLDPDCETRIINEAWFVDEQQTHLKPQISFTSDEKVFEYYALFVPYKYEIVWEDEDGTVLETDASVAYGTTPSYDGATPTKAATAQYTYTFAGWSPEVSEVTGDATYKATYTATINQYKVTFVDEDGITVLKEATAYDYGTSASDIVRPTDPTKAATAQYTYTFAGWSPEVTEVTGDATYRATYTATINQYEVTFVDEDGTTVLKEATAYDYGTSASDIVRPADPTKAATAEYTYTFAGWTPEISEVTGDITYKATYSAIKNSYTITWKNDDGSVIDTTMVEYGAVPSHVDPSKAATAEYTYTFAGWTPEVIAVTGDAAYTATYTATKNKYTVTWKNGDTVLETDTDVEYGSMPVYDGATPTKSPVGETTYTFDGWNPAVSAVVGDITYTAQFYPRDPVYTITWVNHDGVVLETDTGVAYGATPSYDGETPTKPATAEYTYTFAGWNPEVTEVTGAATYTAQFTESINSYDVVWKNCDGEVLRVDNVKYGVLPSYGGDDPTTTAKEGYTCSFAGWTPEIVAVTGKAEYTATYTETPIVYTITYDLAGGAVDPENPTSYTIESEPITLNNPTKAGYTFAGWTGTDLDGKTTSVTIAKGSTGNREYEATWTMNTLTITQKGVAATDSGIYEVVNSSNMVVVTVMITGSDSVTIEKVPVGTYTVREISTDWTWTYANTTGQSVTVSGEMEVTFTHTGKHIDWLHHEDAALLPASVGKEDEEGEEET